MDSPGQSAIDIKEFASRIVALEALGKPAKSPVPRVTGPEICALVYRAPMYRERLGGIKGMRPIESLEPISLFPGSTFLDVPCDFVVRSTRPAGSGGVYLVLAPTLSQLVAGFDALLIQPSGPRQKALQPRCYFPNVFTARLPPSTPLDLAILHPPPLRLKRLMCAYCVGHDTPTTQESSANDL
ncbi:hypothetical protein ALC60_00241 [Trachymyrmex zeteki]|uniref:Uncharacterized protein n=1 Tax=Mycetomoellerius zeteki TaxID=64791 RepID=A0A151XJL9_9HYME|nr:hypothetical protein ALC60_00241 [Trachymyrmex zeteki]